MRRTVLVAAVVRGGNPAVLVVGVTALEDAEGVRTADDQPALGPGEVAAAGDLAEHVARLGAVLLLGELLGQCGARAVDQRRQLGSTEGRGRERGPGGDDGDQAADPGVVGLLVEGRVADRVHQLEGVAVGHTRDAHAEGLRRGHEGHDGEVLVAHPQITWPNPGGCPGTASTVDRWGGPRR